MMTVGWLVNNSWMMDVAYVNKRIHRGILNS